MTNTRVDGPAAALRSLVLAGVSIGGLLAAFVALLTNLPPGSNAPFGLHPPAVAIFARHWSYPSLALPVSRFAALHAAVILGLWVSYFFSSLAAKRLDAANETRRTAGVVLAFACLYNAFLALFLPPVLSGDVFHYALFGRMTAWYGLNPYLTMGDFLRGDAFWSLTLWRQMTTPYGPAWSVISALTVLAGGQSVLLTLILFKCVAAVSNLAAALLVFALARRLGCARPIQALLLFAWNPLILIESAGSAHNDVTMIALALYAVLLAARGRVLVGLAALLVSALVKYLTFLLVPLYVAFSLSRSRGREAVVLAARMGIVGAAVVLLSYLPFWPPMDRLPELLPGFTPSFNPIPNPLPLWIERAFSALLDGLFGSPRAATLSPALLRALTTFGFGCLLSLQIWSMTRRSASWGRALTHYGWATLAYAYIVFGSALPWYLISPLAVSAVLPHTRSNQFLLFASSLMALVGFVLGYGDLRNV